MEGSSNPIQIVFEEDTPLERIAEFVELLSNLYGEDLDLVSVHDIPPQPRLREAV